MEDGGTISRRTIQLSPFNGAHPVFKDHFPGEPIVPAFMQMALVRKVFIETYGVESNAISIRTAKFTAKLPPDTPVTLTFEPRSPKGIAFTLSHGDVVVSSGEIRAG